MKDELEFEIARLKLEPGDILVLKTERRLTADMVTRAKGLLAELLPGVPTIILDDGATLEVITKAQIAEVMSK